MFSTNFISMVGSGELSFDPDAQAFFTRVTAAGGTLSNLEKEAVNELVLEFKEYNIWSLMKAIYPMVGASSQACAQNLKSSDFTGTFSAGWTFASTGILPNASNATFDTGFNPITESQNVNSNHLSVYLRTNPEDNEYVDIGQANNLWLSAIRWTTGTTFIYNPTSAIQIAVAIGSSNGLSVNTRRSTTDFAFFYENIKLGTNTSSNTFIFSNSNVHIGSAGGSSFYSGRENAFGTIGNGLTDLQQSYFYDAVQAFQTTLSRQV